LAAITYRKERRTNGRTALINHKQRSSSLPSIRDVPQQRNDKSSVAGVAREKLPKLIARRKPRRSATVLSRWRLAAKSKIEDQPQDDSPKSKIRRRRGENRPSRRTSLSYSIRACDDSALVPSRSKIAASSREIIAFTSRKRRPV
jgi:hypothetical protein